MSLFLASSSESLGLLLQKIDISHMRVGFVTDASEPYIGTIYDHRSWVFEDRKFFEGQHCEVIDMRLSDLSESELEKYLSNIDILHVSGGSVSYLINILQQENRMDVIKKHIISKQICYIGTSAGAMVMAPSVELYVKYAGDEYEGSLVDHTGFGLVPFLIWPHANRVDSLPLWKNTIEFLPQSSVGLITLRDGQALWVNEQGNIQFLF